MKILSLNTGSSTVKYRVCDADTLEPLFSGRASRIGEVQGQIEHEGFGEGPDRRMAVLPDHQTALKEILEDITAGHALCDKHELAGVGHRIVHGGDHFTAPVRIDDEVLAKIRELGRLAPLHNAVNAIGVEVGRTLIPGAEHVAVFNTAFHATLPAQATRYAIPDEYVGRGFRRYGFHGISHAVVAVDAARHLNCPLETLRLITLHLGSGASAAAICRGISVDTSMGMTPLEGLVMGTRSGDLDPGMVLRFINTAGLSAAEAERLLNEDSGLLALADTSDMRDIAERAVGGEPRAEQALDLFCYRVKKYIGAYLNPATDGAVLPILHLNGYKIANPTVLARLPHDEFAALLRSYGHAPYFVEGDAPKTMHQAMAATLDTVLEDISAIQDAARADNDPGKRPAWPLIILRSPKGWTGPETIDGQPVEGNWRSHQVAFKAVCEHPESIRHSSS